MFDEGMPKRKNNMVTIATFNEPAKAKHLKDAPPGGGIKADVHNEGHLQTVAIHVETAGQREGAWSTKKISSGEQSLMLEWEASDPEIGSAMRCPQCNHPGSSIRN